MKAGIDTSPHGAGSVALAQPQPLGRRATVRRVPSGWRAAALAALFLVALGTRAIGLGGAVTEDEDQWIARSGTFAHGLTAGDWRRTYLTGHPGVTVMWLTTLTLGTARTLPFERTAGAPDVTTVPDFLPALLRARVPFAMLQAGLAVLAALLTVRLLGPGTGLLAGLLLAAEPFWAGVGPVVGMDGLLSGFLTVSLLALLLAVAPGSGGTDVVCGRARVAWGVLAGVMFAFAFLTKTTALFLGPVVPALLVLLVWRGRRQRRAPGPDAPAGWPTRWWAAPLLVAAAWGVAAVLVVWVLWPAAWQTPVATLWRAVTFSARLGGTPHGPGNFLLGQPSDDPGVLFYPTALLVRLGPGTFIGLLLLFVFGAQRAALRVVWPLLGYMLLFLVLLTFAAKKVDRYLLPILPTLGILAAIGWLEGARALWAIVQRRLSQAPLSPTRAPAFGKGEDGTDSPLALHEGPGGGWRMLLLVGMVAFGLQVWPLVQAGRYPLAGYNPLVGGVRTAEYAIPVGWGDGLDVAADRVREMAGPRVVVTAIWSPLRVSFGAHAPGPVVSERQMAQADFYIDYVHARQRGLTPRQLASRSPDATVTIGWVDYARIYRLR